MGTSLCQLRRNKRIINNEEQKTEEEFHADETKNPSYSHTMSSENRLATRVLRNITKSSHILFRFLN